MVHRVCHLGGRSIENSSTSSEKVVAGSIFIPGAQSKPARGRKSENSSTSLKKVVAGSVFIPGAQSMPPGTTMSSLHLDFFGESLRRVGIYTLSIEWATGLNQSVVTSRDAKPTPRRPSNAAYRLPSQPAQRLHANLIGPNTSASTFVLIGLLHRTLYLPYTTTYLQTYLRPTTSSILFKIKAINIFKILFSLFFSNILNDCDFKIVLSKDIVRKRGLWSGAQLREAIELIENENYSVRAAGIRYGIPESTIRRRLKSSTPRVNRSSSPSFGRLPVFDKEQEKLFSKAYYEVASPSKGINGFESTGIYPPNRHIFHTKFRGEAEDSTDKQSEAEENEAEEDALEENSVEQHAVEEITTEESFWRWYKVPRTLIRHKTVKMWFHSAEQLKVFFGSEEELLFGIHFTDWATDWATDSGIVLLLIGEYRATRMGEIRTTGAQSSTHVVFTVARASLAIQTLFATKGAVWWQRGDGDGCGRATPRHLDLLKAAHHRGHRSRKKKIAALRAAASELSRTMSWSVARGCKIHREHDAERIERTIDFLISSIEYVELVCSCKLSINSRQLRAVHVAYTRVLRTTIYSHEVPLPLPLLRLLLLSLVHYYYYSAVCSAARSSCSCQPVGALNNANLPHWCVLAMRRDRDRARVAGLNLELFISRLKLRTTTTTRQCTRTPCTCLALHKRQSECSCYDARQKQFPHSSTKGANPNLANAVGQTPMHVICETDSDHELAETIFEISDIKYHPIHVDAQDETGNTPLHVAAHFRQPLVTEILLRKGANPNLVNHDECTPLHFICKKQNIDVDLVKTFIEISKETQQAVHFDIGDKFGDTPLHLAVKDKNLEVVELLLRNGADPDCTNEDGLTPLHIICQIRNSKELLKKFFEINNNIQQTVLVDMRDNWGNSPLHLALRRENRMAAEVLLRNGADPNSINKDGLAPLHVISMRRRDTDLPKMLLELSNEVDLAVQLDIQDKSGNTPLHLALDHGLEKVAELLLTNGADPNVPNREGFTALHIICQKFFEDDLSELLFKISKERNQPLHIDARDNLGRTPLQLALQYGSIYTAELLLINGADPNLADSEGLTSLHVICQREEDDNDDELANMFFDIIDDIGQSVQVDAKDKLGRTPLRLAVSNLKHKRLNKIESHQMAKVSLLSFQDTSRSQGLRTRQVREKIFTKIEFACTPKGGPRSERVRNSSCTRERGACAQHQTYRYIAPHYRLIICVLQSSRIKAHIAREASRTISREVSAKISIHSIAPLIAERNPARVYESLCARAQLNSRPYVSRLAYTRV
ncbi:unnamed protein product [Trichogramma brassicae]|uniref:HTH psq-type domain-containing protein n=1 Tax=Trichogramma brassicae TaxID=86971 RepID=A0A6H5I517_9HYME|nr:unnamed protein product [Trichogramma brassicae]